MNKPDADIRTDTVSVPADLIERLRYEYAEDEQCSIQNGWGESEVIESIVACLPEPVPSYPEWDDELCIRVAIAIAASVEHGDSALDMGRAVLSRLHDRGLSVVPTEELERLRAEVQHLRSDVLLCSGPCRPWAEIEGAGADGRNGSTPPGKDEPPENLPAAPAPSQPDDDLVERVAEAACRAYFHFSDSWSWSGEVSDVVRTAWCDTARAVLALVPDPDPEQWVPKERYEGALASHQRWREMAQSLERKQTADPRPTEEEVREAVRQVGQDRDGPFLMSDEGFVRTLSRNGWLRGSDVPARPPFVGDETAKLLRRPDPRPTEAELREALLERGVEVHPQDSDIIAAARSVGALSDTERADPSVLVEAAMKASERLNSLSASEVVKAPRDVAVAVDLAGEELDAALTQYRGQDEREETS